MPKATLVPCPDCGESGFTVFIQELNGGWQGHCGCGHATRYCKTREAAIAAWNALPRALPWTYDPPKVAGDYHVRQREDTDKPWSKPRIVEITNLSFERNEYWQFAGPIPLPMEG